jgi:hypothetical protein
MHLATRRCPEKSAGRKPRAPLGMGGISKSMINDGRTLCHYDKTICLTSGINVSTQEELMGSICGFHSFSLRSISFSVYSMVSMIVG